MFLNYSNIILGGNSEGYRQKWGFIKREQREMNNKNKISQDSERYKPEIDLGKYNKILFQAADPMHGLPGFKYKPQDFDSFDDFKLFLELNQYLKRVGPKEHLGNPRIRKTPDKHFKYKYIGHVNLHKKEPPIKEPFELTGYHLDPGIKKDTMLPGWTQGAGESHKPNYPLLDIKKSAGFNPSMRYWIRRKLKIKGKWEKTKIKAKWPEIWPGTEEPSPYDDIYGPQRWYKCLKCHCLTYPKQDKKISFERCPFHGVKHETIINDVELDFTGNKDHKTPNIQEQQQITIIKDLISSIKQQLQIREFFQGFKSQDPYDNPERKYLPGIPKSKKRVNRFPPKPTGHCQYEIKPGEKCNRKLRKHKNKIYCHEHSQKAKEDYERQYQRTYKKQYSTWRHQNDLGTNDRPYGPKNKHNKNPFFSRNVYGVEYYTPKHKENTINFMVTHKGATHQTYHKFSLMIGRESIKPGYKCPECKSQAIEPDYLADLKGSGGVEFVCKKCGLVVSGPHDSRVKYPWRDYHHGESENKKKVERLRYDSIKLIYKSYAWLDKEIPNKEKESYLEEDFNPALYR